MYKTQFLQDGGQLNSAVKQQTEKVVEQVYHRVHQVLDFSECTIFFLTNAKNI